MFPRERMTDQNEIRTGVDQASHLAPSEGASGVLDLNIDENAAVLYRRVNVPAESAHIGNVPAGGRLAL